MNYGHKNSRWKGGERIDGDGYITVLKPDHHRAGKNGYVYRSIIVVEEALGKPLPHGSVPHHVNGNKVDDRNKNLVLCQDKAYHMLLEQRTRAYNACGRADWRKCPYCNQYDDPDNLYINGYNIYHRYCHAEYNKKNRQRLRQ